MGLGVRLGLGLGFDLSPIVAQARGLPFSVTTSVEPKILFSSGRAWVRGWGRVRGRGRGTSASTH